MTCNKKLTVSSAKKVVAVVEEKDTTITITTELLTLTMATVDLLTHHKEAPQVTAQTPTHNVSQLHALMSGDLT